MGRLAAVLPDDRLLNDRVVPAQAVGLGVINGDDARLLGCIVLPSIYGLPHGASQW